jgi:hypothetical protein
MSGAAIGVLLGACLDKSDYGMLVGMTCESVLNVMCMHDFSVIWAREAINANPFRTTLT